MIARPADASETGALARLWYDGWQDAHAAILPATLARAARARLAERMAAALADVGVIGPQGAPLGFAMLKGDELYQFYVASEARGAGIAAALMADAETQLSARGVERRGSPVRSATRAARFTRRAAGISPARRSAASTLLMARSISRSGVMRSIWRAGEVSS